MLNNIIFLMNLRKSSKAEAVMQKVYENIWATPNRPDDKLLPVPVVMVSEFKQNTLSS